MKRFSIGTAIDRASPPSILANADAVRYHSAHMGGRAGEDLVMFVAGIGYIDGCEAGTHDGIRDSARSGRADFSGAFRAYCSKEEWISAGNGAFWE